MSALLRRAPELSDNAFRVGSVMATTALDTPNSKGQPAARYFGGWEPLAAALRPSKAKDQDAVNEERVRRAVKELVGKRLVRPLIEHARDGERQTYDLSALLSDDTTTGPAPTNRGGSEQTSPYEPSGQEPLQTVGSSPYEPWGPRSDEGTTDRSHSVFAEGVVVQSAVTRESSARPLDVCDDQPPPPPDATTRDDDDLWTVTHDTLAAARAADDWGQP